MICPKCNIDVIEYGYPIFYYKKTNISKERVQDDCKTYNCRKCQVIFTIYDSVSYKKGLDNDMSRM